MQTYSASSSASPRVLAALLFATVLVIASTARGQDLVVDNGSTYTVNNTQGSGVYENIIVGNSGGGTVNQSGGNLFASDTLEMGVGSLSSATYNLSGGALTVQGQALIGIDAFEVNFKQSGGSFTVDGDLLQIGGSAQDNSFYTLTGGSLSTNQIQIADGEVDQSAGTVTTNGHALLIGTLANTFDFYNLTGGTLTVGSIGTGNSSAESTVNWNGGTIQAAASTTSFFQGLTYTRVRNNGATFDTNGYDVTVAQALIHSTLQGDNATDGGLTKNGSGTLTLSGANTYNGATTVNAGTLVFADHTPASANLSVASGATLQYDVSGSNSLTQGGTTIVGAGTLVKSDTGTLVFGGNGTVNWDLGAGALINVTGGTLTGGNFGQDVWTNNLASLTVASGATFRGVEANVQVDALNGAGTVSTGYDGAGYQSFTVGVNGGSGTFSGSIVNTDSANIGSLTKAGAGVQTLTGASTYSGATNIDGGTLQVLTGGSISSSGNALSLAAGTTLSLGGGSVSLGTADGGDLLVGTTANNKAAATVSISAGSSLSTVDGYVGFAPGSNGSISQSGGTYNVADFLFVAYDPNATATSAPPTGSYTLSGGQLFTGTTQVGNGGTGTFTQTGGSQTVGGFLYLGLNGGSGTYNLGSGSSLTTNATFVGYSGANGGTGNGMFIQTGGTASNANGLVVGANAGSSGTYTLSSGTLTTNGILVGNQGNGLFNQSGGSVQSSDNVVLGNDDGSGTSEGTGAYNLSGGTLSTPYLLIGQTAATAGSIFTQSDGTCTVSGAILFGYQIANSAGTYNLNGGTLTTNQILRNAGSATFNFNGGTLQAGASSVSFMQGLTAANVRNAGANIDTNGFDITVAQKLTHSSISGDAATDGGLTKIGAGVLTLLGANTYTGGTTVSVGTLLAKNTSGSATGSGAVTVKSGATLGGSGSIAGGVTVNDGGTLSPGLSPVKLTLGSLTMQSGSMLTLALGGTTAGSGYDQIDVGGPLSLDTNLNIVEVNNFSLTVGETFTILDNTSSTLTTGLFTNAIGPLYTDGSGNTFLVDYAANADAGLLPNDVTLTVQSVAAVPEPSTWILLIAGVAYLAARKIRRQKV